MALEIYDQVYPYINGDLLCEAISVESGLENNDQDVFTLKKGWAGQTPSPKKRVTNIENAHPQSGFEFDFEEAELKCTIVTLGLQTGGGSKMLSNGFIRNTRIRTGAGESTSVSFEHHGEPSKFS